MSRYVHTIYMTVYSQTCMCVHVSYSAAAKMQNTIRMDLALVTVKLSMRFEMTDHSHLPPFKEVYASQISVSKKIHMHKDQKAMP